MIQLDGVSKTYATNNGEVRALDDVSLSIATGEFVAVRGPSGCGKSTMLSLVGGLALPTSGTVSVDGSEVSRMSQTDRAGFRAANIGFVFQMFHLLPYLNVLENVLLASSPDGRNTSRLDAEYLLEQFGLTDRLTHRPGELSAGERQRVAMARALLNRPKLLMADEPTGNLDPKNATALMDLISKFHKDGGTVMLVTHDEKAAALADRTIHLASGRVVELSQQP
ncbi:MAG: ABC transporter ATP-binding protein [Planctomycetes bacterium]|nr:ABC transporter ATP-binding protein [Planctomycetota bacterium]